MTLARCMQALLDLVETDRSCTCNAVLGEARERATAMLAAAHAQARARMRQAFGEERERREIRLAEAQARLQTHRRLHDQRHAAALLAAGWKRLPDALIVRWRQSEARRAWVEGVVAQARVALPRTPWRIVHAGGWPEDERAALAAALAGQLDAAPQLVPDEALRAGLKVAAGGNVVDGTLAGLLADRAEAGAKLLHHLEGAA